MFRCLMGLSGGYYLLLVVRDILGTRFLQALILLWGLVTVLARIQLLFFHELLGCTAGNYFSQCPQL